MPPWLYIWLLRFSSGERLEKAKSYDYRLWFGVLFLMPVLFAAWLTIPKSVFDGSLWAVWLAGTVFGLIAWAVPKLWARFVPATISLVLAVVAWVLLFIYSPFR